MEALLGLLGSAFGGGATGFFGSLAVKWFENKDRKDQREHDRAMATISHEEIRLEGEYALKLEDAKQDMAVIESEREIEVNNAQAFGVSLTMDKATYGTGLLGRLVDFVRGMMRPIITSVMVWQLWLITDMLGGLETVKTFTTAQKHELFMQVVVSVIYLTTMAVGWWFGSRATSKPK